MVLMSVISYVLTLLDHIIVLVMTDMNLDWMKGHAFVSGLINRLSIVLEGLLFHFTYIAVCPDKCGHCLECIEPGNCTCLEGWTGYDCCEGNQQTVETCKLYRVA